MLRHFLDVGDNAVVWVRDRVVSPDGCALAHLVVSDVLEVQRVNDFHQLILPNGCKVVLHVLVHSAVYRGHCGKDKRVPPPTPERRLVPRHHGGIQVAHSERILIHQPRAPKAKEEHEQDLSASSRDERSGVGSVLLRDFGHSTPRELRLQDLPDFCDGVVLLLSFLLILLVVVTCGGGALDRVLRATGACSRSFGEGAQFLKHFLLLALTPQVLGDNPHTNDGQEVPIEGKSKHIKSMLRMWVCKRDGHSVQTLCVSEWLCACVWTEKEEEEKEKRKKRRTSTDTSKKKENQRKMESMRT